MASTDHFRMAGVVLVEDVDRNVPQQLSGGFVRIATTDVACQFLEFIIGDDVTLNLNFLRLSTDCDGFLSLIISPPV